MRDWQNHEAPEGYVNRKQAAEMLGVSPRTFRRMLKRGDLEVSVVTDPISGVPWTYAETFSSLKDLENAVARRKD
jgi:hypothetical protein